MSNPVVIDATPGQSYADITREFEAPVEAVFRAHADPDLYKSWVGPRDYETQITRMGLPHRRRLPFRAEWRGGRLTGSGVYSTRSARTS